MAKIELFRMANKPRDAMIPSGRIVLALFVAIGFIGYFQPVRSEDRHPSIIVLTNSEKDILSDIRVEITRSGGRALHIFPPLACIAELSLSQFNAFQHDNRISLISESAVGTDVKSPILKIALSAWNTFLKHRDALTRDLYADPKFKLLESAYDLKTLEGVLSGQSNRPQVSDALIPPPSAFKTLPVGVERSLSGNPYGANFYDTSEFFMGDIVVGVLILESAGHDYDWSDSEIEQTLNGIVAGMDWWAGGDPRSNRTFTYDIHVRVPISAEPINGSINDDYIWGEEALATLGYSTGDIFFDARHYLNDIRSKYHTNWATLIFAVDSDPRFHQGLFAIGGGYAHAYIGGPWMTMARYSSWAYNEGNYYTCVPAHETGHLFYAMDEYDTYANHSGYFNTQDNDGAVCIMNQNSLTKVCDSTRLQMGWRYSGGDTPDILNVPPTVTLDAYTPDPTSVPDPTFNGVATTGVLKNLNPIGQGHAITLNTITSINYSLDTVNWSDAISSDGRLDSASEHFTFTPVPLFDGSYTFYTRATDNVGHISALVNDLLTINTSGAVAATDTISFGDIYVGASDTLVMRIVNNSGNIADVAGASISNPSFSLSEGLPFSIGPHDSKDIHVCFLPSIAANESGILNFSILHPDSSSLVVTLTGSGARRPIIQVSPESLNVTITVGDTLTQTCTISAGTSDTLNFSATPVYPLSPSARVLLVSFGERTSLLLDSIKMAYTLVPASAFDTVALSNYKAIVFGSTKSPTLLQYVYNRRNDIRQFIEDGGGIVALTEATWNGWKWLPDTVIGTIVVGQSVHISDSSHPVMWSLTDEGLSNWFSSYLNVFTTLPAGYNVLASTSGGNDPLIVGSEYGVGRIILSGLHNEQFYRGHYPEALRMLSNMIHWALRDGTGWLSTQPTVGSLAGTDHTIINLKIRWEVLDAGEYRSDIHFASNDPIRPDYVFPVHLSVIGAPKLVSSVDTIRFGNTFIGYPETLAATISNDGSDTLRVTSLNSNSTRFRLIDSSSFILGPRRSRNIYLQFVPENPGTETGTLSIASNDPDAPLKNVQLVGEAAYTLLFNADSGWNILSVPYLASNYRSKTLYPSASSPAFSYSGHYEPNDTLRTGRGYWLKFSSSKMVALDGLVMRSETVDVAPRWNLFGAISFPVGTADIHVEPPATIVSPYFGYSSQNGYSVVDVINPGIGYWVKSNGIGKIILQYGASSATKSSASMIPSNTIHRLIICDALSRCKTLYFTRQENLDSPVSFFELPPLPPEGAFDVRFSSNLSIAVYSRQNEREVRFPIEVREAVYPLEIRCELGSVKDADYAIMVLPDGKKKRISAMNDGTTITIDKPAGGEISLAVNAQKQSPEAFALFQNYPNPFNPTTEIRYAIREAGFVTLKIYDVLGREVATLVNLVEEPGYKSVTWDASGVASGLYFFRLTVGSFTDTKKLLLLR